MNNWLDASSTSNKYRQMYIKGFLDVSGGNIILRNNHLLVNSGDASLNGKLFASKDASFNSNLRVGNTTTLKTLFVTGDVSMNGNVFINFKNSSIPPEAIIGGIPASTGTFDVDLSLNKRLSIQGDVSARANLYVNSSIYENGVALINKYAPIGAPTFTGTTTLTTASISNNLLVSKDASLNGNLYVVGDATFTNRMFVGSTISEGGVLLSNKYAPIASPGFTGIPTAPTASSSTNTTQIATTQFVTTKINNILDNVQGNLSTLNALATAVNFDPSFSYNVLTQLSGKVSISNPEFVGTASAGKLISSGDISGVRLFSTSDCSFNGNLSLNGTLRSLRDMSVNTLTVGRGGGSVSYNAAFGYQTLSKNTSGSQNVAIGYQALLNNITGNENTGVGCFACINSTGSFNTAIGSAAYMGMATGSHNVAVGYASLYNTTSGVNNTALGSGSLQTNTTGSQNVAIGRNAGNAGTNNTTGSNNTFVGCQTQLSGGQWSNSTALGINATITGNNQVVLGTANEKVVMPGDASLNGNIVIGRNLTVLGNISIQNYTNNNIINTTTTNYQLIVSEDLSLNGRLVASGDSSFNGNIYAAGFITAATQSINDNSTRLATTAYTRSLVDTSLNNALALYSTKAIIDSSLALYYTKTAIDTSVNNLLNTAYSTKAIIDSSLALYSTKAIVDASLALKANSANPTFTGITTIPAAVITNAYISGDASMNSRLYIKGDVSMNNLLDLSGSLIAHNNVNVYGIINQYTTTLDQGYIVNYNNISGNGDITANGVLLQKTGTNQNTAYGISAANSLTTGANNTIIGYNSGASLQSGSNNIIIGSNASSSTASISNEITLGNNSISVLRCQANSITSLSDLRDKKNIEEIPVGLNFINEITPVKFDWNTRDGSKIDITDFGFIAQDLQNAETNVNTKVPHLVHDNNPDKLEASYGALIPIMVKAIKELSVLTANQQEEINRLKQLLGL
uniref:Peptidase S74 domain-containing protein n=1 Tax=viral metagenome TaxID=1070528 RepID=A0A6C0KKP1_9ZZZZ